MQKSMVEFNGLPAASASLPELQGNIFGSFLEMCSLTFTEVLRALCHNRARTPRKISKMMTAFGSLQQEANEIDAIFSATPDLHHPAPLVGGWLLVKVVHMCIDMLALGFELDL